MIKTALVIGLSMGRQYAIWFEQLGFKVFTVDIDPGKLPNYIDHLDAIEQRFYDVVYIGTPNFTHEKIARDVGNNTRILLIEKPGLPTANDWSKLVKDFPNTRIMMVKNNQYRLELSGFKHLLHACKRVNVTWSRKSGIPGSDWFRQRDLAFGGVSRDLMPHLLSYYTALTNFSSGVKLFATALDKHNTGVDDFCEIEIINNNITWTFKANWQNNTEDIHCIEFVFDDYEARFQLGDKVTAFGGCPAAPYMAMIKSAEDNLTNNDFWEDQFQQDLWIHKQIERL